MLRFVWPIAFDVFSSLNSAQKRGVTPFPAIFALGDSRIHICSSNCSDIVAYIKAPVDEKFSVLATLNIPYIDPNNGHVRFWQNLDNSRFGCKSNVVENVILLKNSFDIR